MIDFRGSFIESFLRKNRSVEITANEISEDNTTVCCQKIRDVILNEIHRSSHYIEGIYKAMRKTAEDEQRDAKEQRQIILLSGKRH